MIIGIDGNEANVENRVGIGEYGFELLQQFESFQFSAKGGSSSGGQISNFQFQIYLKDRPLNDLPKERMGWKYRIVGPRKLWTQIGLPFDLYTHSPRPDVFFTPTHYAPRFSPIPTVVSVMDLSYIHYPDMFKASDLYQLRSWTAYSVRRARKVLTISKSSKNDIIKTYGVPAERVIVTYLGIKSKIKNQKSKMSENDKKLLNEKYGIGKEYILFVGTLQPRKNVARLIEALSKIKKKDLALVIVGKRGWLYEEILGAPKKFGVEDRVKFLDFVPDADLPALYQNAQVFVLPSLYEGFGLPVLEAMQYGCPVITSNVSSLPEAGGDAARYVDPANVEDIAGKIEELLGNEKLRNELIKKGYKQVKKFSWEKTASQTLEVLEEVGKGL